MKQLFTVTVRGKCTRQYFAKKAEAKALRDRTREALENQVEPEQIVVSRGPDHWKEIKKRR